jgi:phage-related tail protein
VSALAKSAPSGRSLAVPLYVIGSLIDRGLPSDQALQKVQERLQARATDADLQALPAQAVAGQSNKPAQTGRDLAATKRPAGAGAGRAASGAPAGVPANAGAAVRPTVPQGHRP